MLLALPRLGAELSVEGIGRRCVATGTESHGQLSRIRELASREKSKTGTRSPTWR